MIFPVVLARIDKGIYIFFLGVRLATRVLQGYNRELSGQVGLCCAYRLEFVWSVRSNTPSTIYVLLCRRDARKMVTYLII